jgi:hypothetical protein
MRARVAVLAAWALTACTQRPAAERPVDVELERIRVVQAMDALAPRLGKDAQLIELRATTEALTAQAVGAKPGEIVEYRCAFDVDGQPSPLVAGPTPLEQRGNGLIEENAFALADVDLGRITAAFEMAKRAVDPTDGRVEGLVIRRNLPFGKAVRARIYVHSPRMSGSMDTTASGSPIKP